MKLVKDKIRMFDMKWCEKRGASGALVHNQHLHYKMCAYISTLYNNIEIADVGARFGDSGLAFSYNQNNRVTSYDIVPEYVECMQEKINKYGVQNWSVSDHNNCNDATPLLSCHIIFIDIDPHDGIKEKLVLDQLMENDYKGILIFDDCDDRWPLMRDYFHSIDFGEKYDLTEYAHYWGKTQLLNLSDEEIILV